MSESSSLFECPDRVVTEMQETGRCYAVNLTVAQMVDLIDKLGLDPTKVKVKYLGWLQIDGVIV